MRLFIVPFAPNVLRVQILAAEKGIALEVADISLDHTGYHAINPLGQVPALELDDGRILTESLTICQYLDETSGAPFLFGGDTDERLQIAMWERRGETRLFNPGVEYGHHTHPMFAGRTKQFPDFAATLVPKAEKALSVFADQLERTPYVVGDRLTVADITSFMGYVWFVVYGGLRPSERASIRHWSGRMIARESMTVLRDLATYFNMPPLD
ncbi:MAG: glutathione S-transferase family protein [Sphingomonadaceae bacterium]|nr:glutathione S-transferase family protein [Sphingomonadaceae bacterium]